MNKLVLLIALSCSMMFAAVFGVQAQNTLDELAQSVETSERGLDLVYRRLNQSDVDDEGLVDARGRLDDVLRNIAALRETLTTRIVSVDKELEALGPQPKEGVGSEPSLVIDKRQTLSAERATYAVLFTRVTEAGDRAVKAIELVELQRSEAFTKSLIKRTSLDNLWERAKPASQSEFLALTLLIKGWWNYVVSEKLQALIFSSLVALVAAILLLALTKFVFRRVFSESRHIEQRSYISKLIRAFWRTVLPSLALIVFIAISFVVFQSSGVLTTKIGAIVEALFPVFVGIYLVRNLTQAVFSPYDEKWRMLPMDDVSARHLANLIFALAVVNGADVFLGQLNEIQAAPLSLTVVKSLIAALLIGILLMVIALVKVRGEDVDGILKRRRWPAWAMWPILAVGVFIILAAFSGYIGLARFVSQQVVVTGAIVVTLYIGVLIAREVGREGVLVGSTLGRFTRAKFGIKDEAIDQFGVVLSLLTMLLVILIGIPLLFLQWGSKFEDIAFWAEKLFLGFQVGMFTFSLAALLVGLITFAIVYLLSQVFRNWLDRSVLARSRLDTGVRDSIRAGIGYAGLALALLFGITSAGVDLSSLAIVAGALSLGIGFGLQNIVSNFVSGLILLIERPIKVGDWVEVSGVSGFVRKISVRATEIETFNRQSVIVPNSELINSKVGNWTHKNRNGRIDIPVGVSYDSDPRQVEEILYGIANDHKGIAKHPPPFVLFSGFGDSSLDFELRIYISDITQFPFVVTDARFAIFEAFRKARIEIPFPQRDIHVRSHSGDSAKDTSLTQATAGETE